MITLAADDGPDEAVQQLPVGRLLDLRLHALLGSAAAPVDLRRTAELVVLAAGHHAHVRLHRRRRRGEGDLADVLVLGVPASLQHELRGRT